MINFILFLTKLNFFNNFIYELCLRYSQKVSGIKKVEKTINEIAEMKARKELALINNGMEIKIYPMPKRRN